METQKMTVGDGFRFGFGFALAQIVIGIVIALGALMLGLGGAFLAAITSSM